MRVHDHARPTTLSGLFVRAVRLTISRRRRGVRRALGWFAALLLFLVLWLAGRACGPRSVRVGTFNIENYPKSTTQRDAALAVIEETGVSAMAVEEIRDPELFAEVAKQRLGESWRFVYANHPAQRVGVLFDSSALRLLSTATHADTELYEGAKPVFEARLAVGDARPLRILVVHLRAGANGRETRARQIEALARLVGAAGDDSVVLLGDFNATERADLEDLEALAAGAHLTLATSGISCTSYWNRSDGCVGVTLDHILTTAPGTRATVGAACATEGCASSPSCPAYRDAVSDHCPVWVEVPL
ncbi:MAG: endonuclease/exonuclease/phosphatase family protein [Polyangiaceae bacterium]